MGSEMCIRDSHGTEEKPEEGIQRTRGDGNAQHVIDKGKEQILFDVAYRGSAQSPCTGNAPKVAFDQRDAGTFHGHVGARADAMPTSDCTRAGASLIPSPTMPTT